MLGFPVFALVAGGGADDESDDGVGEVDATDLISGCVVRSEVKLRGDSELNTKRKENKMSKIKREKMKGYFLSFKRFSTEIAIFVLFSPVLWRERNRGLVLLFV